MLFKDEAEKLLLYWENYCWLSSETMVGRTAALLSKVADVPKDVLEALDQIYDDDDKAKIASSIYLVTRYLRRLTEENKPNRYVGPVVLRV